MSKKLLALLLAAVMVLSMFAGCGSTEPTPTEGEKTPDVNEGEEVVQTEAPAEPEVVTWYLRGATVPEDWDMVMEDLNKKIQEKINVTLDIQLIVPGDFNDKMTLATTSGDTYEIAWTSNWSNPYDANMARGAFQPLDDLINEYGQGILENCPKWLLDVGRVDGELYAIPSLQITAGAYAVYIQRSLAEEYGWTAEQIDSLDDLYPFLDWVKENHPEMVPASYANNSWLALDTYEKLNDYLYIDRNDPSKIVPVSEADVELMKLYRSLYDNGYIRQDIATVTDPTEDRITGRYACLIETGKPGGDVDMSKRYEGDYIMCYLGTPYITCNAGQETMNAISVNADHPEAAMKLLNLMWTDTEIFNELLFGLEGVHYNKVGDTAVELVEDSGYYMGGSAWYFANQFDAWTMPGQAEDVWVVTEAFNNSAEVAENRGFVPNYADYQTELAQLAAVLAEYKVGVYTCDDLDAFIAERNAKLEAAGLDTLTEGIQAQLDAWRAANGK